MIKMILTGCLAMVVGTAVADEQGDAQKLWRGRHYREALQSFSELAKAGNPTAQLYLGEMYGFGEGTKEDLTLATHWLQSAAQAGVNEAQASLELVRRRAAHKADIQYYIELYDGTGIRYEKFNCVTPKLDEVAKVMSEVRRAYGQIRDWQECFGRFAINLNTKARVTNTIPDEVLELMNQEEFDRATAHIDAVHMDIVSQARLLADDVKTRTYAWLKSTEEFLVVLDRKNRVEAERIARLNELDSKWIQELKQHK